MNKSPKKTIKLNLSKLMETRGLNADEVSRLCDEAGYPITRATIHNLTNPHAKGIYYSSLVAICYGLKVTPAELLVIVEEK